MIRRSLAFAAAMFVAFGLSSPPTEAASSREDFSGRLVVVSQEIGTQYTTRNGTWVFSRDIISELSGSATVGDVDYVVDATGDGINLAMAPFLTSTTAFGVVKTTSTWTPVAGGDQFVCTGILRNWRVPTDPPFPFAEEGVVHNTCDNGLKWKADLVGQFELDPATGIPVFTFTFDGKARWPN